MLAVNPAQSVESKKYELSYSVILKGTDNQCPLLASVVVINWEIGLFAHMSKC